MFIRDNTLCIFDEVFQRLAQLRKLTNAHSLKVDQRLHVLESELRVILFDLVRASINDKRLADNNCNLDPMSPLK